MTTEEKAKAYDKAREKIASRFGSNVADEIFSQFEMSGDEKIRKELISYFKQFVNEELRGVNIHDWITWLEKQDEQKPVEWSEEDEYTLGETIQHLEELIRIDKAKHCGVDVQYYQRDIDWLKSLKERVGCEVNCTTTKEWSEEDERIRKSLIASLSRISANTRTDSTSVNYTFIQEINWLKSLRPQNTWKPSDEQMYNLRWVGNVLLSHHDSIVEKDSAEKLNSLYEDLKKLKE